MSSSPTRFSIVGRVSEWSAHVDESVAPFFTPGPTIPSQVVPISGWMPPWFQANVLVGGVVGGILGHQIGSGRGQDLATGIGAAGGAVVGANVGRVPGTTYTQDVQRCENVASAGSTIDVRNMLFVRRRRQWSPTVIFGDVNDSMGHTPQSDSLYAAGVQDGALHGGLRHLNLVRILRERRANAQSLLISLASDADRYNDSKLRARTLARMAGNASANATICSYFVLSRTSRKRG